MALRNSHDGLDILRYRSYFQIIYIFNHDNYGEYCIHQYTATRQMWYLKDERYIINNIVSVRHHPIKVILRGLFILFIY